MPGPEARAVNRLTRAKTEFTNDLLTVELYQ